MRRASSPLRLPWASELGPAAAAGPLPARGGRSCGGQSTDHTRRPREWPPPPEAKTAPERIAQTGRYAFLALTAAVVLWRAPRSLPAYRWVCPYCRNDVALIHVVATNGIQALVLAGILERDQRRP